MLISLTLSAQTYTDSLELAISNIESNEQQLTLLMSLTEAYMDSDLERALTTADRGLQLAPKTELADQQGIFIVKKAEVFEMMGLYPEAHEQYDLAIAFFERTAQQQAMAETLCGKARIFQNQGKLDETIVVLMEALEVYEDLGNQSGVASVFAGISDCMFFKEEYQEGVEYGERAIELYKSINETEGLVSAYDATSSNYLGIGDYDKALETIDAAVAIQRNNSGQVLRLAGLINSRGNAYKYHERYEEALADYKESNRIATELQHPGGMSATWANISDVYMRMDNYEAALPYKQKSVDLMEESGFHANLMENYSHLSEIYKNLGDYPNALKYHERLFALRDSMMSVEKDANSEELRTKYETEKKELIIEAQDQRFKQQRRLQWLMLAGAGLLILILVQTYRNYRIKEKSSKELQKANNLLEKKISENELLLKEIHHRVKNNLQTVSSLLNLQSQNIEDSAALSAVRDSQHRVRSIALMHQKLYVGSNLASIEMKDYFKTMAEAIIKSYGPLAENITFDLEMDELELDIDTAIPLGLIVNELITNSMKHAFPDEQAGQITISMARQAENSLVMTVSDNGVPSNGNSPSSGTGFGTQLVNLLAVQIDGKLERLQQNGTATILQFPMDNKRIA